MLWLYHFFARYSHALLLGRTTYWKLFLSVEFFTRKWKTRNKHILLDTERNQHCFWKKHNRIFTLQMINLFVLWASCFYCIISLHSVNVPTLLGLTLSMCRGMKLQASFWILSLFGVSVDVCHVIKDTRKTYYFIKIIFLADLFMTKLIFPKIKQFWKYLVLQKVIDCYHSSNYALTKELICVCSVN